MSLNSTMYSIRLDFLSELLMFIKNGIDRWGHTLLDNRDMLLCGDHLYCQKISFELWPVVTPITPFTTSERTYLCGVVVEIVVAVV